ncbi:MAG: YeeE/YedE family protein [Chitinophagaceae bacterium]|nr:YeeE/YedE family protein [Chitinophagaceae bacterium]
MQIIEWLRQPWPWYVAGPLIGLTVPALLVMGNRRLGVSSSLRHICAACLPVKAPFFQYDWKKEVWNLFFVGGILLGGWIAGHLLRDPNSVRVEPALVREMSGYGVRDVGQLLPASLFHWGALLTLKGWLLIVAGGFLVGFGTRYAGGCTSGHSIMGLSTLQWPSLVATVCFMAGGFLMANVILPFILKL